MPGELYSLEDVLTREANKVAVISYITGIFEGFFVRSGS